MNRRHMQGKGSTHIPLPVYLESWEKSLASKSSQLFEEWDEEITQLRKLWDASIAKKLLREQFQAGAKDNVQIKKIVCFGLGCLQKGKWSGQCILQYFAAFTIAETLNEIYQAEDESTPDIQIFFQEVKYPELDRDIWRKHAYKPSKPVDDPHGFLLIDENTFVIAPHIPNCVPVLQICADVVEGGPAGFICDRMDELDLSKREYCVWDRISPRVVRMLSKCRKMKFDGHKVEDEIRERLEMKLYWLWKMQGWWKPKGE
ncbi:uncharacterized protein EI97DRAFT_376862 [Westerdykella ornata]|uniref:SRR1-like domain-containing protein n=1 Tax=Westerdykella ornata TaxID=318751 RepID=A0A6A6JJR7_WESOR|nr:uncharacterized protein EI97DRAFT_376862 [Westerdykella ornata]KAF2276373.1 hypothetical protein EI97DRAFT_376862 [Westerdykella ornata]